MSGGQVAGTGLDLDAMKAQQATRRAKAARGVVTGEIYLAAERDLTAAIAEVERWRCICHEDIPGDCPYCVKKRAGQ